MGVQNEIFFEPVDRARSNLRSFFDGIGVDTHTYIHTHTTWHVSGLVVFGGPNQGEPISWHTIPLEPTATAAAATAAAAMAAASTATAAAASTNQLKQPVVSGPLHKRPTENLGQATNEQARHVP